MSFCGFHREIWLLVDWLFFSTCEPIFLRMPTLMHILFSRVRQHCFPPPALMFLWSGGLAHEWKCIFSKLLPEWKCISPPEQPERWVGQGESAQQKAETGQVIPLVPQPSLLLSGGWDAQGGDLSLQNGDPTFSWKCSLSSHQHWSGSNQVYDSVESLWKTNS